MCPKHTHRIRGPRSPPTCLHRMTGKPVCIYTNGACSVGVCAYSDDFVTWNKSGCMTKPPNPFSEVSHDTSIFRDGPNGTWYTLSGGRVDSAVGMGTAQLWNSTDLITFNHVKAITPGGLVTTLSSRKHTTYSGRMLCRHRSVLSSSHVHGCQIAAVYPSASFNRGS